MAASAYPSDATLLRYLTEMLTGPPDRGPLSIAARTALGGSLSHPSEVVAFSVGERPRRVVCKYGLAGTTGHLRHGHRHGSGYEADVYRGLLADVDVPTAGFVGAVDGPDLTMLVLEYLEGSVHVSRSGHVDPLEDAARWLARFHRQTRAGVDAGRYSFLHRYTGDYYGGWADRALSLASGLPDSAAWLPDAARLYRERAVAGLLDAPTAIHGEFYPGNVLVHDGVVTPVDWESAAIGAPEIDVACLVEGWAPEDETAMVSAYTAARWPEGAPPVFGWRLESARMYLQFRWLGESAEWTTSPDVQWRFDLLRTSAERLRSFDAAASVSPRF